MIGSTHQSENIAEKITGRDDNSQNVHLHFEEKKHEGTTAIAQMYRKIVENSHNFMDDDTYYEVTESLLRYKSPKGPIKELEVKLTEANRADLIEDALELKEFTTKFMTRYEASCSGQFILVNILATIARNHRAYVVPAIVDQQPRVVIDSLIDKKVIQEALNVLNGTDKVVTSDRIYGLMYYLAGNCHIKWTV